IMKKIILLLSLALMSVGINSIQADSSNTNEFGSVGSKFVQQLVKQDFAGAAARFDSTMKAAMSESQLGGLWNKLQQQAGSFKTESGTRVQPQGKFHIVFVTCQFAKVKLDVKVVLDSQKKIAGLFFIPVQATASPAHAYTAPSYATSSVFREKNFTVGSGEWALPGTLTLPTGDTNPLSVVILVHGSGPNDRDESIGPNKPFRDLAGGLATKGIAVLRYEKRTKQHGEKMPADVTVQEEIIDDVLSAAAQLRSTAGIDPKRIFVLGHSLGGIVAPRIGKADPKLAGLILFAGAATRSTEDAIIEQSRYISSLHGKPSSEEEQGMKELMAEAEKIKKLTPADASSQTLLFGAAPKYWLDLRAYDAIATAKSLKQPLLVLQGGRDYQVTEKEFNIWKTTLGSQPNFTFKLYPNLNHLFMAGVGMSTPAEYEKVGHVEPVVVADIVNWIKSQPTQ
ncbi:MAG: alpha/beta fold hydrolase, partial [Verrucomicrobiota bacterium]